MRLIHLFCLFYETYALTCKLQPILRGINVKLDLGSTRKKILPAESDCKGKCAEEKDFNCTAILWPAGDKIGDCYLFDKIDLSREMFLDQRPFILYVDVCEGKKTPSVGYCQFLLTKNNIKRTTTVDKYISPGSTSESACHHFCVAKYGGIDCNGYIVSSTTLPSPCTLYSTIPAELQEGDQNLWTKKCKAPPINCGYTSWQEWTECSASCGGGNRDRFRKIKQQPSEDGVQCLESEMIDREPCNMKKCDSPCIYTEWTKYGQCNATCTQTGVKTRTRAAKNKICNDVVDHKICEKSNECNKPCMYSEWSNWSNCLSNCEKKRVRTLKSGNKSECEAEIGFLQEKLNCTGDLCDLEEENGNNGVEKGCRINSIDPSNRPSSIAYKVINSAKNCANSCARETSFRCEAYIAKEKSSYCVIYGPLDNKVIQLSYSKYYIQDIYCKVGKTKNSPICHWQKFSSGFDPNTFIPQKYASIGLTIDANHCGQLCMMNHPIFKPNPCISWAWSPLIGFTSSLKNCFMFDYQVEPNSSTVGRYDVYKLICEK